MQLCNLCTAKAVLQAQLMMNDDYADDDANASGRAVTV